MGERQEPAERIAKVWSDGHVLTGIEVVRCKDCRYYCASPAMDKKYCFYIATLPWGLQPNENDYCSKGERK